MNRRTEIDCDRLFAAADDLLHRLSANGGEVPEEKLLNESDSSSASAPRQPFTEAEYYQAMMMLMRMGLVERRARRSTH